ncbi:MAG: biopolymer transporter ExbD [Nitrospirae bacterium]|nr:biopolymer transporter ExbD [Nitrospirota bacterium]MBF0519345.1 biopolymer transporter ExbD [Nitrospirota bacterium]MBF0534686.1 biopolymer transporter ExbD [Nitrospirota bacterium]MBF0616270.1 biopolymer transporter ExbD [Nitrospirota bacterium]
MLVLLVIFMVTAPMMKQGMDIELPKTKGTSLPNQERFTVSIKKDGVLYLNTEKMTEESLIDKLRNVSTVNPDVYLEADKTVPYGRVAEIMAEIKAAGIEKLGLVTEPKVNEK